MLARRSAPITVRRATKVKDGRDIEAYEIVAGRHRYEAVCSLGAEEIACVVTDDDDLHAQLWEIDENLMRAELSPSERASCTARRKEIYEALHPEAKHGGDRKGGGSNRKVCDMKKPARFTAETAAKTGKSERSVQLDAARGERLRRIEAYQGQITNTSLDKGAELDALTRLPIKEAQKLITSAANGEAVSAIAVERARKQPSPPKPLPPLTVAPHRPLTEGKMISRITQVKEELRQLIHECRDDPHADRTTANFAMAIFFAATPGAKNKIIERIVENRLDDPRLSRTQKAQLKKALAVLTGYGQEA